MIISMCKIFNYNTLPGYYISSQQLEAHQDSCSQWYNLSRTVEIRKLSLRDLETERGREF